MAPNCSLKRKGDGQVRIQSSVADSGIGVALFMIRSEDFDVESVAISIPVRRVALHCFYVVDARGATQGLTDANPILVTSIDFSQALRRLCLELALKFH